MMVFGLLGQDLDNRQKFSQSEMEIKRKRGIEEMPGYIATLRSDWAQPVNPEITRILLRVLREDIHRDLKIGDKHGWFPIGEVMSYLSGLKDERYSFARVGLNVLRSAVAHEEYRPQGKGRLQMLEDQHGDIMHIRATSGHGAWCEYQRRKEKSVEIPAHHTTPTTMWHGTSAACARGIIDKTWIVRGGSEERKRPVYFSPMPPGDWYNPIGSQCGKFEIGFAMDVHMMMMDGFILKYTDSGVITCDRDIPSLYVVAIIEMSTGRVLYVRDFMTTSPFFFTSNRTDTRETGSRVESPNDDWLAEHRAVHQFTCLACDA
jgi:RNA:NAD 2'-phosphotransferase (TPT1/KptA family)